MVSFLKKNFNRCLPDSEKDEILSDFPKPNIPVLIAPKLDKDVEEQLRSKGKDPYFGQEKVLYRLQETLLDVSCPLMCLRTDLKNPRAKISKKDTLLLTQRALVLLGSAFNAITLEWREITLTKINPNLKALTTEPYKKREDQLFGPGFLEKALKKLETQKALAKVYTEQASRKLAWNDEKTDLCHFYQEASLWSTAAGISATPSCTTSNSTGSFTVQAFTKDKKDLHVHLRMGDNTACFYVGKIGGLVPPRLSEQACWWCLQRNIILSVEYLPGTCN